MRTRQLLLVAGLLLMGSTAAGSDLQADFVDRWVKPTERLTIRLAEPIDLAKGELRVFAGNADMTVLLRPAMAGELVLDPNVVPLPVGESELVVYQVLGNNWNEIGRFPLRVLTPSGMERITTTPRLDLNVQGRVDEGASGDAFLSDRGTYADLAGNGGITLETSRADMKTGAVFNFVGSSYQNAALRFGVEGEDAPKVDLSDYRVDFNAGKSNVAVGHVSYGNNPLLLSSMASRGLVAGHRFNDRLDVSVNAMNGTSIVGYNDFFGLQDADHRIYGAGVGYEILPDRPGGLRMEVSYLDASIESRTNFNTGEIPDAETSNGFGVQLTGSDNSGRLRGGITFARSNYTNPYDPLLAQGGDLQPVREVTRNGRIADVSYALVQNATWFSEKYPATLSVDVHHERVDPQYRSLGAFFSADQEQNRVSLSGQMAGAQLQLGWGRQEDNLDDIPTLLKTRTDNTLVTLNLPVPQWMGEPGTPGWWPNLSYSWQQVHQLAINAPDVLDSGFAASQLPDQMNRSHQINASWGLGSMSLSYGIGYATQDNRQPGREKADYSNLSQQFSVSYMFSPQLNANLGVVYGRNHSFEQVISNYTTGYTLGANWQIDDNWSVTGNVSLNEGDDSLDLAWNRSDSAQLQVARRLEIPAGLRKLPGQVFVRYSRQGNEAQDNVFDFNTEADSWFIDAGLSLSLF